MGEVLYAAPQFGSHAARHRTLGHAARILIVDADPAALAAIAQALQHEGHFTATAFDAAGATAIAERLGPFELLITDMRTTPIDDNRLCEALRSHSPDLQVLYLARPFSESELMDAVASRLYWAHPRGTR